MYSIDIDINNYHFFSRLSYYIFKNNNEILVNNNAREFILDEQRQLSETESVLSLISKNDLVFLYKDQEISIQYERTQKSTNFQRSEVRFEKLIVKSNDFQHLCDFVNTISDINIPDAADNELCKYVWKEDRWFFNKGFKKRKIETIYLPEREQLVKTLDDFLNNTEKERLYTKLDIPSKKVFLFYGIPGSGKTSTIRALASHFGHNISIVKNVIDTDDVVLERMLGTIRGKTFIVFEDIDCLFENREMISKTNVSYSGILNMLDGIANYNKLVIFITTNHIEKLDSAFKRRVDKFVEFGFIQKKEIIEMYKNFFEVDDLTANKFYDTVKHKKLTVNMLEKYFIQCIENDYEPDQQLKLLDDYSTMSSGDKSIDHLYL